MVVRGAEDKEDDGQTLVESTETRRENKKLKESRHLTRSRAWIKLYNRFKLVTIS